jgi:hypothetical protein
LTSKAPAKAVNKPGTGKPTPKPVNKPAVKAPTKVVAKPATKTVSEVWKEKTGTDWSEAKKQGLTDGSAKANLALLAKLNKGEVGKSNYVATMEKNIADEMSGATTYAAPVDASTQMKRGGLVKNKKKKK